MIYDDKQMSKREGLYTVIGAFVLAVLLFVLMAVHGITRIVPATDKRGAASAPHATTSPRK